VLAKNNWYSKKAKDSKQDNRKKASKKSKRKITPQRSILLLSKGEGNQGKSENRP
jgi:hypothetical protein